MMYQQLGPQHLGGQPPGQMTQMSGGHMQMTQMQTPIVNQHPQQQQQQQQQSMSHHQNHYQMQPMLSSGGSMMGQSSGLSANGADLMLTDIDKEKEKQARENHCEIERRRRVKMAAYFNELCVMVPTCNTLQRKPDKLTILRMASSHMRNLRQAATVASNSMSNPNAASDNSYKPSFLTDQELKHLILEAADGFLFVAQCDTANIIYVSDAVQPVLSYLPAEWMNRSLYEFVHPDDLDKVKDQLSTQESGSSGGGGGRILDLKTGTVKKEGHTNSVRSHMGTRRSFICRVKMGPPNRHYMDANYNAMWSASGMGNNMRTSRGRNMLGLDSSDPNKSNYLVVHVTGYTKIWPPNASSASSVQGGYVDPSQPNHMYPPQPHHLDEHGNNLNTNFHLIAIARIQMTSAPSDLVNSSNYEFVTRHDQNGLITFVDQRVTSLLGYQPNEMLKKHLHEFCLVQDQQMLKDQLKLIYETKQTTPVQMTLHMIHSNSQTTSADQNPANMVKFKTSAYAFCNPCNDAFEFIVCTHQCVNRPLQQSNDPLALNPNTNNNSSSNSNNNNLLMNNQPMNTNLLASNLTSLQPASGTHLLADSVSAAYTNAAAANQPQYHTLSGQYSHLSQSNWSSNPSPLTGQVHSATNNSPPTSTGSADQSAPYASNYILMPGKY